MKKYLKYVIAVIMAGSCGIWFLPMIAIGGQQLSLLEFMKVSFGFYTSTGDTELIYGCIREQFHVFARGIAVFGGVILLEVFLTVALPGMSSYVTSLVGSILNWGAIAASLWISDRSFTEVENALETVSIDTPVDVSFQVLIAFLAVYGIVFIFSLLGIVLCKSSKPKSLDTDFAEEMDYAGEADLTEEPGTGEETNVDTDLATVTDIWTDAMPAVGNQDQVIYPAECLEKIYFVLNGTGVAVVKDGAKDSAAILGYEVERGEYQIRPLKSMCVFLKSGQPLGKGRDYNLPRETKLYIQEKGNMFTLA